ncbi:NADH:ubiquinone oxidoreductase [Labilibaculum filiforme]|uniref:NADH:ubiquinone oxidoreductase n=1 Tax=Labilibaculum filiforme TaxID=1940526 RepID=A0A2N3I637_9BACT|nr:GxxExxY protein [Labilibaculum filiforme]PKQ65784.1 NADH:ubiquinone oxidoreductase [Labilibaculum filiforme]
MNKNNFLYKNECFKIIGSCMTVHSELGFGFLEAVYQEALELELRSNSIPYIRESQIDISYKGNLLSKYYLADFLCFDEIIIELKAVKTLEDIHAAQILNYLKATKKRIGLLINFGTNSLQYKRFIL